MVGCALLGHAATAFPQTPVALVDRTPTLPKGEALVGFGAGTWLRANDGGLPVGSLDLRYGVTDRLEIRMLLPGLAFTALAEGDKWPGIFLYGGLCALGFSTIDGSSVSYQVGLGLTKRVHSRLRLRLLVEFRHRVMGKETDELAIPGPLPSARAMVTFGEMVVQIHGAIAATGALGFSAALGEGRSHGFGSVGFLLTVARRMDLYTQLYLERSRGDRPFDPAVFGGIAIRF
jgi:hypothetical protein